MIIETSAPANVCIQTIQINAHASANALPRVSELAALSDSLLTINRQCSNLRTSQNMVLKLMDYGVRSK